ncbi:MAG: aldo/keto reductase, partial [Hyphomicrobiales bacterium]|nr:aldo/keto reductase [Hyphomicrobiales bacterium]
RLRTERLDLVQLRWLDIEKPKWRDAAHWLVDLQQVGAIDKLGATNFNTAHVRELCAIGRPLATLQVQYSLIDDRPAGAMAAAAAELGFRLLCYGTVAGGFLSDRWLGRPEPREPLENRSLTKYKLIIDDRGGWDPFQALLRAQRRVADRHGADIATVASRAILDQPQVAGVIVGARDRSHLAANLAVNDLRLTSQDRAEIDRARAGLLPLAGDVYDLERDRTGRHGAIMKYNLNDVAG